MSGAEATVRKLHDESELRGVDTVAVPAIDVHMQFDLGGGRSVVMRTVMERDIAPDQVNKTLDMVANAADRMRARYDLRVMQKDLRMRQNTTKALEEDLVRLEMQGRTKFDERLKTMATDIVRLDEEGAALWTRSKKQGHYRPEGDRANKLATLNANLTHLKAAGYQPTAEEHNAVENAKVTLKRHHEGMGQLVTDIKEAELVIGSG